MDRVHDWRIRLASVVMAAQRADFEWGRHDCALFALDCIDAQIGTLHAKRYRGRYTTARGSVRVLKRDGDGTLATSLGQIVPEIDPADARPGDIALIETDDGPAAGLVRSCNIACLSPDGLVSVPRDRAVKAWRVSL